MLTPTILFALAVWQPEAPKPESPKPAAPAPAAPTKPAEPEKKEEKVDPYVLGFKMQDIDGKEQDLAQYKGKVVMIVNVASRCGYTPQYKGLQELYDAKKDKGFVILAFPANDFASQEPGKDSEIKDFCTSTYKVTFPMFAKVSVKGKDQCELYKKLAAQPKPVGGDPKWNFQKFLVDKQGNVVARYDPKAEPKDIDITKKIDELLAAAEPKKDANAK